MTTTSPLSVALIWHMHQPCYKEPGTNNYSMPWVRLHTVKDYYPMALILEKFPSLRLNFNLVPSLLEQIIDYVENGATDRWWSLSCIPAADLTREQKKEIIYNFFMVNWENILKQHPRYNSLLHKRGKQISPIELDSIEKRFTTQDILDLQVWFNLSWFHSLCLENDQLLRRLIEKGGKFTESDKLLVMEKQCEIMAATIPLYKKLQEEKIIEITTSPFYHPILPLLCNTDIARRAIPHIQLPKNHFSHPEDASWQVQEAVNFHYKIFSQKPRGMWPSEGGVSEEIIPIVSQADIQWLASDEAILACSLGRKPERDGSPSSLSPEELYQPYQLATNNSQLAIVFRDRILSDLIGFTYANWEPSLAAHDLVSRLEQTQKNLATRADQFLVTIILDGENAWEYYPDNGRKFLTTLYEHLTTSSVIKPATISEFINQNPPRSTLSSLYPGSWINHDFRIWIGHDQDNLAWDYLSQTRTALVRREQTRKTQKDTISLKEAWRQIYIAEGSDWCWWYGDDHSTSFDHEFDELFRKHLKSVYLLTMQDIPSQLNLPIYKEGKSTAASQPIGLINPALDGRITSYYEWLNAGHYDVRTIGGTMHQTESIIKTIYYGFNTTSLFLRLDTTVSLKDHSDLKLVLNFTKPVELKIHIDPKKKSLVTPPIQAVINKIVEIAIPFTTLSAKTGNSIELTVILNKGDHEIERWPRFGSITTNTPGEDYNEIMWSA